MKTLEQVKEHLSHNYYDCSDKICGFLVGCELKDTKEVIKFLKDDKFVYNFDDFLEWFDEEEDEEEDDCDCHCCKSAKGYIPELHKHFYNTVESLFHDVLLGKDIVFQVKEEPKEKPLKYQGESRDNIVAEYKKKKEMISELYKLNKDYNSDSVICAIRGLEDKSRILSKMLEERVDE